MLVHLKLNYSRTYWPRSPLYDGKWDRRVEFSDRRDGPRFWSVDVRPTGRTSYGLAPITDAHVVRVQDWQPRFV